jgi:hypothetical protein
MSNGRGISRIGGRLRSFVAVALALSIPIAALAQTRLGTVFSSSPFELRGANVNPAPGVPNWPVMSGDTFQAGNAPLTLILTDGSTIIFAPGTRVTLGTMVNGPVVRLESGSGRYTLQRSPSEINFYCRDERISISSQSGDLDCGRKAAAAAAAAAAPAALGWVAGGAAAGTAIGLALRNGPPVSPARCGGVGLPACP